MLVMLVPEICSVAEVFTVLNMYLCLNTFVLQLNVGY